MFDYLFCMFDYLFCSSSAPFFAVVGSYWMLRYAPAVQAAALPPPPARPPRLSVQTASRRALLPATLLGWALPARADDDEAPSGGSLPLKAAKLGGIVLIADLVTAAILGKSVLGLFKPQGDAAAGKKDWKDKLAVRLSTCVPHAGATQNCSAAFSSPARWR
jgi:hypothetical protein